MRKQFLLISSVLLLSIVYGQTPICNPETDRHCFGFEEHDVESTYDGVGEIVTRMSFKMKFVHCILRKI